MNDATRLAAAQLGRMRGMTNSYHRRFFGDIRFGLAAILVLFGVAFWEVEALFLAVPVVALWVAVQTAFDASYLIFARQYAARLETYLNGRVGETVLVGAHLEADYLFPHDRRKIVTAAFGKSFSWFGFVTLFFTALGGAAGIFGLLLGWPFLTDSGDGWAVGYLATLGSLTAVALGVGGWWFVGGEGERRLSAVLDEAFPRG